MLTDEGEECEIAKELEKAAQREKLEATRETSGNSNASAGSGSSSTSSGSGSLPHSFSVEEIQNVRKQLKVSVVDKANGLSFKREKQNYLKMLFFIDSAVACRRW